MISIKHNRAALFELGIAIASITGLSISDQLLPSIIWKIGVAAGLSILCAFFIISRDKQNYRFKANSPQLAKFFTEWYLNEGELFVYCNDLDWVSTKELDNALVVKASEKRLFLYLKVVGTKANHLKNLGAQVCQVNSLGTPSHKFSILKTEGFKQIICRNKVIDGDAPGGLIEFISTNTSRDPHLIALAEDVLTQCPPI